MKTINCVGIVGLGNISLRHRKNVKQLFPGAAVCLVSSSGREVPRSSLLEDEILISNIDELIAKKPDFAVVCSPATFHHLHAARLLGAGIPTLIEKPLAATDHGCVAMINAAEKSGTDAAVGYCLRFMPAIDAVKAAIDRGMLGEIVTVSAHCGQYLPDWRPSDFKTTASARQELGGGALLELSHELDYLRVIFGNLAPRFAWLRHSQSLQLNVEDIADLMLEGEHGTPICVHLNFLERRPSRWCEIAGEQGAMTWDLLHNTVVVRLRDAEQTIFSDPQWDRNQMYLNMISAFVARDFSRIATLHSAQRTVQLIQQLRDVARSGCCHGREFL